MTDDRGVVRAYSQDRQTYRHNSISINKRKTSTHIHTTSENYYTNRNCPEILSLFNLTNKHLDGREKQIYHSVSNDAHYFNMINYPIRSPTPMPNLALKDTNKQLKFPKVTSRVTTITTTTTTTAKKFPTLTPRATSKVDTKTPVPKIRTSVKPISSSLNKPSETKIPTVSTEKKKTIQLSQHKPQAE